MQPTAEVFISTAVADKTGVELDSLAEERREVLDKRVWEAAAPEKGQGERSRFGEGVLGPP